MLSYVAYSFELFCKKKNRSKEARGHQVMGLVEIKMAFTDLRRAKLMPGGTLYKAL